MARAKSVPVSNDQVIDQAELAVDGEAPPTISVVGDVLEPAVELGTATNLFSNHPMYTDPEYFEKKDAERIAGIMAKLNTPTPLSAIKTRKGGSGKDLRYLSGDYVIAKLNEATGGNYDVELIDIGEHGAKVMFVNISTPKGEKPAMLVAVKLTVLGLGSKVGFGIQILQGGEDMYKGALTDGLKKAATLLGLGLDLYDPDFEPVDDSEPAPVLTAKDRVVKLLKERKIATKAQANEEAQKKYNKDFKDVTLEEFGLWAADLERSQPAPF